MKLLHAALVLLLVVGGAASAAAKEGESGGSGGKGSDNNSTTSGGKQEDKKPKVPKCDPKKGVQSKCITTYVAGRIISAPSSCSSGQATLSSGQEETESYKNRVAFGNGSYIECESGKRKLTGSATDAQNRTFSFEEKEEWANSTTVIQIGTNGFNKTGSLYHSTTTTLRAKKKSSSGGKGGGRRLLKKGADDPVPSNPDDKGGLSGDKNGTGSPSWLGAGGFKEVILDKCDFTAVCNPNGGGCITTTCKPPAVNVTCGV